MEQEERETETEKTDGEILLIRPREPGGRENSRLLKALREGLAGVRLQEVTEVSQLEAMTDESGRLAPEGWTGNICAVCHRSGRIRRES